MPELPRSYRPFGVRAMGSVLVVGLYGLCAFTWFAFDDETRARFTVFEKATLIFFGLLILVLVHALTRSRVEAPAAVQTPTSSHAPNDSRDSP